MGSLTPALLFLAMRSFFALTILAFAALGGTVGPATAQGAVKSVHNDWQVRCDTPPGAQGEQCALIQSVTAEDRANVGLTVIVLKTADQKSRLMEKAGASMALGAFLAGLLLAESNYRHELEADIEPFRGLLLALFFMISLVPA